MNDIKARLKENGGYLRDSDFNDFVKEFGEDYPVIVKSFEHGRLIVPIKDVEKLPSEIQNDIKEVFINSEQYEKLFS